MVKKKMKVINHSVIKILISTLLLMPVSSTYADTTGGTTLQANVVDNLTVSISTPTIWAAGNIDTFLRNKVSVSVVTNNTAGFTASMTTKTDNTSLTNTSKNTVTLSTLQSGQTRGNFPANYWGYSLGTTATLNNHTYNETEQGNESSNYYPLVGSSASPIIILSSNSAASGTQDVYFGAKADATKASGTYSGTVVISVVTGVIDDNTNPITPENPAQPNPSGESGTSVATYTPAPTGGSNGSTTYTYTRTSGGTSTTTTQVSGGNTTNAYDGYTPPQGVKRMGLKAMQPCTLTSSDGMMLIIGLGIAALLAAILALIFLILLLKRKKEEDEEQNRK